MFEKLFNKNLKLLPISTIFIVLTLIICISFQIYSKKILKTDLELNCITFDQTKENEKAKISSIKNILLIKDDYYLVLNDDTFYVAKISVNEIKKIRKDISKDKKYTLYGESKKIDKSTIEEFVKTYNKLKKDETITKEEYNEKFGYMYLDQKSIDASLTKKSNIVVILSLLLVLTGITISIIFIKNNNKNYKLLRTLSKSEIAKLNKELNKSKKYKNIYITESYIVLNNLSLDLIKYESIIFAYKENNKIIIYTKSLDNYKIKDIEELNILKTIKSKNKNVLIDKTPKNIETLSKKYNLTIE
mgnify:CR=1 FL=1